MITLGNHTWRRSEIGAYLADSEQVIRPANFSPPPPAAGSPSAAADDGTPVAVINVLGSLFLEPGVSMFELIDELVEEARAQANVIVVDVHAEATSEKVALAHWLDGRSRPCSGRTRTCRPRTPASSAAARRRSPTSA